MNRVRDCGALAQPLLVTGIVDTTARRQNVRFTSHALMFTCLSEEVPSLIAVARRE